MHRIQVLDGFNRVKKNVNMSDTSKIYNRFGTGASAGTNTMQGFNRIMQGYKRGTQQDLEDWRFLVDIEHPAVMNGFDAFLDLGDEPMNGKKREERRAKKAEKKAQKQDTPRGQRKEKRQERKAVAKQQKGRKKEVRTAKKEERLQKKISKREEREADKQARRARKQQRLDDKKIRQSERQEARKERGGRFAQALENIGVGVGAPLVSQLVGGEGMFQDMTFSDIPQSMIPGDFEDFVDTLQDMDAEDALMTRDVLAEDMGADASGAGDGQGQSSMMPWLIGGGIALAVLAGKKGKKKK